MSQQGEQKWAEHTALGSAATPHGGLGDVIANWTAWGLFG